MSLTNNAIQVLSNSAPANPSFNPVVQVVNVKRVTGSGGSNDRFRVILSDGQHIIQGMLATQLNQLVHSNDIAENTLIKVKEYLTNLVQGKTVVIILQLDVLSNPGTKFGNPVDFSGQGAGNTAPQAAPSAPPMYNNRSNTQQQPQQSSYIKPDPASSNPYQNQGGHNSSPQRPANNYGSHGNNNSRFGNGGGGMDKLSSAPIVRSSRSTGGMHYIPIAQLNMYQNRWTIRARVTSKGEVKTWSNARGEGSLFSFEVLDESGHDIRSTCFKEAVDRFYDMLQVDKVYTFSGGRIKVANMQYNTCKSGFEITFDQNSEIHLVEDDGHIKKQQFEFQKIANLEQIEPNQSVDIVCVVKSVAPVGTVLSKKSGQELFKSDLTVADDSGTEVNLTVWGEKAKTAETDFANNPVVAFKRLRVSDYGGRSLSVSGGTILVNPNIPEAQALSQWWNTQGKTNATRSLSSVGGSGRVESFDDRKVIGSIKGDHLGYNEKPDWLSFKATFNFIKHDKEGGPWYTACVNPNDPCKNRVKVTQTTDGFWHCDRCNQTNPTCMRRYIFSATITDDTCTTWVSLFDEQAMVLLGEENTADKMNQLYFENDEDRDGFEGLFAKSNFSDWVLKCKVKQEMVGDEQRVKTTIYSMSPIDYVKDSKDMLAAIANFS